jgi:hypothetical protein
MTQPDMTQVEASSPHAAVRAARFLAFAAAPTFAAMGLLTVLSNDSAPAAHCSIAGHGSHSVNR